MSDGKGKRVVIVCTSIEKYPDGSPTGVFLSELSHPYYAFVNAGYDVKLVSISGSVQLDPSSLEGDFYDAQSKKFVEEDKIEYKTAPALDTVSADDLDVLFFAGGFGVMWDFPDCKAAQDLILALHEHNQVHEQKKLVGAVCHGPIVLKNVKLSDGSMLMAGKTVAGFSNAEENQMGKYETVSEPSGPGSCEDVFNQMGAKYECGDPWTAKVCQHGNMFTGQNPQSAGPLAEAMIKHHGQC